MKFPLFNNKILERCIIKPSVILISSANDHFNENYERQLK